MPDVTETCVICTQPLDNHWLGSCPEPQDGDVTITLTPSVARALVARAGLEPDERGRYGGLYWALDEAATVAAVKLAEGDDV